MKQLLSALVAICLVPFAFGEEDYERDMAFDNTMQLLRVHNKLNVLRKLRENDFFVPETWLKLYLDEQQALNAELGSGSKVDMGVLEDWASASAAVAKAEKDTMEKLAVSWGSKTLKALTEGAGEEKAKSQGILTVFRQYEQKMNEWSRRDKAQAMEVALYVKNLLANLQLQQATDQKFLSSADVEWHESVRSLYRGALKDREDLAAGIQQLQRERMYLEGCLKAMKEVNAGLEILDLATSEDGISGKITSKAKEAATKYLQDKYGDGDDTAKANIKWGVDKINTVLKKTKETWDKVNELNDDPLLKANPLALSTCKKLAIFSAFYESTIDVAKDLTVLAPIKPLFEIFDYYAKALALVPKFAQAMQGFVNKADQTFVDTREFSAWKVVPGNLDQLERTSLMVHYNLQIATRGAGKDLQYFFLVPEDVAKEGYVPLIKEEYDRLAQALADERAINARKEASRGIISFITENGFNYVHTPAEMLASAPSPAYIKDLKAKARKVPFKEKDLYALARGKEVEHKGRQWTAEQFRTRCETEMDLLSEEFAVRLALPKLTKESMDDWRKFKGVLGEFKCSLEPQQLTRLFTFYHASEGNADRVRKFLRKTAAERVLKRKGAATVGVATTVVEKGDTLEKGSAARLVTHLVVSDLAPGREVTGEITWKLPPWAPNVPSQPVKLHNGLVKASFSITVPKAANERSFDVGAIVKVPVEAHEIIEPDPHQPGPTHREFTGKSRMQIETPTQYYIEFRCPQDGVEGSVALPEGQTYKVKDDFASGAADNTIRTFHVAVRNHGEANKYYSHKLMTVEVRGKTFFHWAGYTPALIPAFYGSFPVTFSTNAPDGKRLTRTVNFERTDPRIDALLKDISDNLEQSVDDWITPEGRAKMKDKRTRIQKKKDQLAEVPEKLKKQEEYRKYYSSTYKDDPKKLKAAEKKIDMEIDRLNIRLPQELEETIASAHGSRSTLRGICGNFDGALSDLQISFNSRPKILANLDAWYNHLHVKYGEPKRSTAAESQILAPSHAHNSAVGERAAMIVARNAGNYAAVQSFATKAEEILKSGPLLNDRPSERAAALQSLYDLWFDCALLLGNRADAARLWPLMYARYQPYPDKPRMNKAPSASLEDAPPWWPGNESKN